MTELAAALKVKYGEERKDKFGETTKVVKQPGTFQPTTLEEEHSQWQDWRLSFGSWLIYA